MGDRWALSHEAGSTCAICQRVVSSSPYCKYHAIALQSLRDGYSKWKSAYPEISWERYLDSVLKLEVTGQWTVEVARNKIRSKKAMNKLNSTERTQK